MGANALLPHFLKLGGSCPLPYREQTPWNIVNAVNKRESFHYFNLCAVDILVHKYIDIYIYIYTRIYIYIYTRMFYNNATIVDLFLLIMRQS